VAAVPSIGRATRIERPDVPGAAAAGDLYERYSRQIFGYCLHQLGSREEAEDAVQTTFMNAFRGLQRGIVPELESAWLFKIAHNVCLSRRRSSWRRGKVEAPNNFEVLQEIVPGREDVAADELIRLQDVLEEMPENQRRAILLREWQGLTYREISDELGLSQAAVETLIFRARRALAQGLEQDAVTWKKRLRRGADAGGAIACVKTLLGGGGAAAIKIGTTTALVATAAVAAAAAPVAPKHASAHHAHVVRSAKPAAAAVKPARQSVSSSHNVSPTARRVQVAASRPRFARAHLRRAVVAHAPASPIAAASPTPVDAVAAPAPAAAPPAPAVVVTESVTSAPTPPAAEPAASPPPASDPGPPPADPAAEPPASPASEDHGNKPDKDDKGKPDKGGHGK